MKKIVMTVMLSFFLIIIYTGAANADTYETYNYSGSPLTLTPTGSFLLYELTGSFSLPAGTNITGQFTFDLTGYTGGYLPLSDLSSWYLQILQIPELPTVSNTTPGVSITTPFTFGPSADNITTWDIQGNYTYDGYTITLVLTNSADDSLSIDGTTIANTSAGAGAGGWTPVGVPEPCTMLLLGLGLVGLAGFRRKIQK